MSERPHVVLFHADPAEAAAWERALAGVAVIRSAADEAALSSQLAQHPADVLVAPCDASLLEAVQRWRGNARLVLCGDTLPEGVLDAAAEGTDLRQVARPEQLRQAVLALTRPRSPMARQRVPGLLVSFAGGPPAEVLDISNRGLSFRLELDQPLESFLPGARLPPVAIRRRDQLVLQAERALVRYVELARDGSGRTFYRVGCELPAGAPQPEGQGTRIDDEATRAGLLRLALRGGGILLQPADEAGETVLAERGVVDLPRREIRFRELVPYERFSIVRGSFELGGTSYQFLSAVTSTVPLAVRIPTSIEAAHRRSAARYRPEEQPILVELETPLFERPLAPRPVLEISSTGFSFAVDPGGDLFPPGLRLSRVKLHLGAFELRCEGEVRNLAPLSGGGGALRCGVSFAGLDPEQRALLADALMRHRFPGLGGAGEFPFEQLWRFFEDTRFIYASKKNLLSPLLAGVRDTMEKLEARPARLFKSVVYHEDRQLVAHLSAVRAYARTFVVQHLAGTTRLHGRQGPRIVNLGISEYFSQSQDLEYVKVYFRPENKWPARVFGGFARKVSDRQRSDLRAYDYALLDCAQDLPETPGLRVIEARGADLSEVEGHFVATERGLLLRSDDLTRGTLPLFGVDELFRAAGLFRQRTVLLALRGDRPVGFALCELSSPGLNLSELLSSVRLVLLPGAAVHPAGQDAAAVQTALLREALRFYRRAERPFLPLLQPAGAALPIPGAPPLDRKEYLCWTCHRTLFRHFGEHVDRLYELLESGRKLRSAERTGEPTARAPQGDAA